LLLSPHELLLRGEEDLREEEDEPQPESPHPSLLLSWGVVEEMVVVEVLHVSHED